MRCCVLLALLIGITTSVPSYGQTESEASPGASREFLPYTDRIILRSGKALEGVKVLSQTQLEVRVEVLPGLAPLVLPAGQVASIEIHERAGAKPDETKAQTAKPPMQSRILPAHKFDPAFSKQLSNGLPESLPNIWKGDFLLILKRVSQHGHVPIRIADAVLNYSPEKRECSIDLGEVTTLDEFFRTAMRKSVPWISIEYGFDEVIVAPEEPVSLGHSADENKADATE